MLKLNVITGIRFFLLWVGMGDKTKCGLKSNKNYATIIILDS